VELKLEVEALMVLVIVALLWSSTTPSVPPLCCAVRAHTVNAVMDLGVQVGRVLLP